METLFFDYDKRIFKHVKSSPERLNAINKAFESNEPDQIYSIVKTMSRGKNLFEAVKEYLLEIPDRPLNDGDVVPIRKKVYSKIHVTDHNRLNILIQQLIKPNVAQNLVIAFEDMPKISNT